MISLPIQKINLGTPQAEANLKKALDFISQNVHKLQRDDKITVSGLNNEIKVAKVGSTVYLKVNIDGVAYRVQLT